MRRVRMVALMAVVLVATAGCSREALKYNNAMAEITKRLETIGQDFGNAVGQHKGDIATIKQMYQNTLSSAEQVIKEGRALQAPDVPKAQELHAAFLEYLKAEEKILKEDMPRMIHQVASGQDSAVQQTIRQVQEFERTRVEKLHAAQREFAQANKFKIK